MLDDSSQSEIKYLDQATRRDHDVARFYVSVDDTLFVCDFQGFSDLLRDMKRFGEGHCFPFEAGVERLAGVGSPDECESERGSEGVCEHESFSRRVGEMPELSRARQARHTEQTPMHGSCPDIDGR